MMSGIRGKNTQPELEVRRGLHARGFRFRLHARSLPGRPDIVIHKYRAAIQVHGCFWHAHHGCRYFRLPASNKAFWAEKLEANRLRDEQSSAALHAAGWRVAIVWECAIRSGVEAVLNRLEDFVRGEEQCMEIPPVTSSKRP